MIESRCGTFCSECTYREEVKCPGCISIVNPFWGVCQVKKCCEDKLLNHCGECSEFPCELLNSFAFDETEGDDGKRIINCQMWAKKSD